MLAEFAEKKDDYNKFYEQFGKSPKLGIHVNSTTEGLRPPSYLVT